jgi:hypothetical protein
MICVLLSALRMVAPSNTPPPEEFEGKSLIEIVFET